MSDADKLWFKQPAKNFEEALPVGNGRLGGMVYGGVEKEIIQLNEDSIWTGRPEYRENPEMLQNLQEVRNMLFNGDYAGAGDLAEKAMTMPNDPDYGAYQPLGNLIMEFKYNNVENLHIDENDNVEPLENNTFLYKSYKRSLNLETAIAKTEYTVTDIIETPDNNVEYKYTRYRREVFCSAADNVLVAHLTSDKAAGINCNVALSRKYGAKTTNIGNNTLIMEGKCEHGGVKFAACLKVITISDTGEGEVRADLNSLNIMNADNAIILVIANSDYRYDNPTEKCLEQIDKAALKNYDRLKEDHIAEYSSYYNRVEFNLDNKAGSREAGSIAERLHLLKHDRDDPSLFVLYFNYGRYLLISGSRPGSLPANLQGIWNASFDPPWFSDYTLNGSLQMNYWPAEVCNIPDTAEPLFNFIEKLHTSGIGARTAEERYGCRGFVLSNRTSLWGRTDLRPNSYLLWQEGAAWLCMHLWEHYLFSTDREFLKDKAYPIMKDAAVFYTDFMVEHPKFGWLVSGPTTSPEITYITDKGEKSGVCMSPAMTTQLIYDLFNACIEASETLNCDEEFRNKLKAMVEKLPPMNIGKSGQLQEWLEDFEESDPGHRLFSHLYGVFPGRMISPEKSPELAEAAKVSLRKRTNNTEKYTGKREAWAVCVWARLKNGEKAYASLKNLLCVSTYPNLLSSHYRNDSDVFQIAGNLGGTAGIAEMLLSSFDNEICLLPALPLKWRKGYIKGLKARGGFTVDITWEKGTLKNAEIYSEFASKCAIRYKDKKIYYQFEAGQKVSFGIDIFEDTNPDNKADGTDSINLAI